MLSEIFLIGRLKETKSENSSRTSIHHSFYYYLLDGKDYVVAHRKWCRKWMVQNVCAAFLLCIKTLEWQFCILQGHLQLALALLLSEKSPSENSYVYTPLPEYALKHFTSVKFLCQFAAQAAF